MAKVSKNQLAYQEWKQRNQIIGQLNQLKKAGVSDDQIRQAGPNAYRALSQVTVKDGQTLDQIAQQNGTTVPDILNANPDMTSPKTGMVLNVTPGSEAWRVQNAYGPNAAPNNAAFGNTTTNPQGVNMWQGTTPGYNTLQTNSPFVPANTTISAPNRSNPFSVTNNQIGANPYASYEYKPPTPSPFKITPSAPAQTSRYNPLGNQPTNQPQTAKQAQPIKPTQAPVLPKGLPSTYPGGFRRWVGQEMEQINTDPNYTPPPTTLAYLEKLGLIKKDQPLAAGGGGFGGYGGYRRGGGGGSGGGFTPRYPQQGPRKPAFSTGAGFGGLVNWRL